MRNRILGIVLVVAALVSVVGWHFTAQAAQQDVIWTEDPQLTVEMREWIDVNRATPGVFIGEFPGIRLVLISAGEKPTTGYELSVDDVVRAGQAILVRAKLNAPGDDVVAQVITYPYAVVGIEGDLHSPIRVQEAETGNPWPSEAEETAGEAQTDSGRLVGRVDMTSVEIRLSGVPDEIDPQVFRLSDPLAKGFESLGIEDGDELLFHYVLNEAGQKVIVEVGEFE